MIHSLISVRRQLQALVRRLAARGSRPAPSDSGGGGDAAVERGDQGAPAAHYSHLSPTLSVLTLVCASPANGSRLSCAAGRKRSQTPFYRRETGGDSSSRLLGRRWLARRPAVLRRPA